jgi:hypothetical protein
MTADQKSSSSAMNCLNLAIETGRTDFDLLGSLADATRNLHLTKTQVFDIVAQIAEAEAVKLKREANIVAESVAGNESLAGGASYEDNRSANLWALATIFRQL